MIGVAQYIETEVLIWMIFCVVKTSLGGMIEKNELRDEILLVRMGFQAGPLLL